MTYRFARLLPLLLGSAAILAPGARAADSLLPEGLTITTSVSNEYLFRGVAQTRGKIATSGTIDYQHSSGFYLGAFASNVDFRDGNNKRQAYAELDLLGGFRGEIGKLSWDLGLVGYTYPGSPGRLNYAYAEVVGKGVYDFEVAKANLMVAVSPQFQGRSGSAVYIEGGPDVPLPFEFTASGRVGRQMVDKNPLFGLPDYTTWSISLSREILPRLTVSGGYFDTSISRAQCGSNACDGRFVATLTYSF